MVLLGQTSSELSTRSVTPRQFTMALIEMIAREHGVTMAELMGVSRRQKYCIARREIWRVLRDQGISLPRIGRMFNRDHTTILHGLRRIETTR